MQKVSSTKLIYRLRGLWERMWSPADFTKLAKLAVFKTP